MSRQRAQLILDPARRDEQLAYVRERATDILELGDQLWASITGEQAPRFAEQGILVQFHPESGAIVLPAVMFRPPAEEPEPPPDLAAAEPRGEERGCYIVQFIAHPETSWVNALTELGASFVEELPPQDGFFRLTVAQAAAARALPFVAWIGLYHPAYALNHFIAGRDQPFTAAKLRELQVDAMRIPVSEQGNLQVLPFADVAEAELAAALTAAGATVVQATGFGLIVNAPPERVRALLRVPGLRVIEPGPVDELFNQRAGIIIGANQVQFRNVDFLTNLDGMGEIVHVFDSGFDNGAGFPVHPDLAGRVVMITNANGAGMPTADFEIHGTHVAGTVGGSGSRGAATVPRGIAPACNIIFTSVNAGPPPAPPPRNPLQAPLNFGNFAMAFQMAHNAGARVHNNSWGNVAMNQYTNGRSGVIDRFAFLNPESVVLFAAGNDEGDPAPPLPPPAPPRPPANGVLDMNQLGGGACAKNVITVGACENETNTDGQSGIWRDSHPTRYTHAAFNAAAGPAPVSGDYPQSDNANQVALFSDRGLVANPAAPAQRRVKPDLVAPGTNVISLDRVALPAGTAGAPPASPPTPAQVTAPAEFYTVLSGTSMATPMVSGSCALVRQFFRTRFGQLRRPQLLEVLGAFVDSPAIAPHPDGLVIAWIRREGASANHIVAARFTRQLVRMGAIVQLQANVGDHPAPALANSGENTLLLFRGADNRIRLRLFDRQLAPQAGFGAGGTVTLAPDSRPEDERRPTLCVNGLEVAVTWFQTGTRNLLFQRFDTVAGGTVDAAPRTVGLGESATRHPYVIHNGTRYAAIWISAIGGQHEVLLRFIENNGIFSGAAPLTLRQQPEPLRDPHLAWNPRTSRYRAVWISADAHPEGDLMSQRFNPDGTPDGAVTPDRTVAVSAPRGLRRPLLMPHPSNGQVLLWEDDTSNGTFDVWLAFLNDGGTLDGRILANRLPISDTPNSTEGFSALVDEHGIATAWLSNDEINSDVRAGYVVNLTPQGAFQAQADPNTPLLNSGRYVPHTLHEHAGVNQPGVALAWAGGPLFHLRSEARGAMAELFLVRTNADGLSDTAFGLGGAMRIDRGAGFDGFSVMWAGTRLMAVSTFNAAAKAFLFSADGVPENTFGTNGVKALGEVTTPALFPQLGFDGAGANFRMVVGYGQRTTSGLRLRCTVFGPTGNVLVAARTLNAAEGTARHGWCHFPTTDTPARVTAVWHERVGGRQVIRLNRYNLALPVATMALHATPIALTALAGDSRNAVLAPRPVLFAPPFPPAVVLAPMDMTLFREYGLAWQNQPAAGMRWQIRFSRLNRDGTLAPTADVLVINDPNDHATDPQLVWHTDGYGLAWLQQLSAGGAHSLHFTVLDQNGVANATAHHRLSLPGADVLSFQLVWNGRSFRIAWTETEGGMTRHRQAGIAVPRVTPPVGFDQPYQHPTSALVRATLINGATNFNRTALPNIPSPVLAAHNPTEGYGWGRVNLRQSLAPAPPVTYHVRDDSAVAAGRTARYEFTLPPGTRLLRVTLAWTDPPGVSLVNNLDLRMITPPFPPGPARTYVGNRWQAAPNSQYSDPLPMPPPAMPFDATYTVEQVVIPGTPELPSGVYIVEVISGGIAMGPFQQFPGQPFSLVFVGSGDEWTLVRPSQVLGPRPYY